MTTLIARIASLAPYPNSYVCYGCLTLRLTDAGPMVSDVNREAIPAFGAAGLLDAAQLFMALLLTRQTAANGLDGEGQHLADSKIQKGRQSNQ